MAKFIKSRTDWLLSNNMNGASQDFRNCS